MNLLIFVILGCLQEPGVDEWIANLSSDEIAVRERSRRGLLSGGEKALQAVQAALRKRGEPGDSATRVLLVRLENTLTESIHDAAQRPRELDLVRFEIGEAALKEVFATIERCTGKRILGALDLNRRVKVTEGEHPLRRQLDDLERQLDVTIDKHAKEWDAYVVSPGKAARGKRIHLPGATFTIRQHPWVDAGKLSGWVVDLDPEGYPDADFESIEVLGADGVPRRLEYCRWCSPNRFLVHGSGDGIRLRLIIAVEWESTYELTVDDPGRKQEFRVGDSRISYEFLKVSVESVDGDANRIPGRATLSYKRVDGTEVGLFGGFSTSGSG